MPEPEENDIRAVATRAEKLINAFVESLVTVAEVAAERLTLASKVAQLQQKMDAFNTVLEVIDAQKIPLLNALKSARGARKIHLERQIEKLEEMEVEVLCKTGLSKEQAHSLIVAEKKLCDKR